MQHADLQLAGLEVEPSPHGFDVRPRSRATSWLIEAAVWLVAGAGAATMLALGSDWVRVFGAVLLVPIGLRALLRTIRFATSRWLRQLTVAIRAPVPYIAGPLAHATLSEIVRCDVADASGDRYFCAIDRSGRTIHLVTLEPSDEPAYRRLASWLEEERAKS